MRFDFAALSKGQTGPAMEHFEEKGFFILDGIGDAVTRHFKPVFAERLQVSEAEFEKVLDPQGPPTVLPEEIRARLSRVTTPQSLRNALLSSLSGLFALLLGPFVEVSTNYHAQFKSGYVKPVDHGGYDPKAQYLEVQGQYLIHQDFSGAALPTSPSGITLWVAMNSCPDWNLRLYPGSHRYGLLCHQWLPLEDPRLATFGAPVDVQAKAGSAVVFNSLLLHSSSNPGPQRRLSCDIRFFPLSGFLPTTIHSVVPKPAEFLRTQLATTPGITRRTPLLETAAFLGQRVGQPDAPAHSNLDWVNYLDEYLSGDPAKALAHMERMVHPTRGVDGPDVYTAKFHNRKVYPETLRQARELIMKSEPNAPELAGLDRLLARLEQSSLGVA